MSTLSQATAINVETEAQLQAARAQRDFDYNEYLDAELAIVRKSLYLHTIPGVPLICMNSTSHYKRERRLQLHNVVRGSVLCDGLILLFLFWRFEASFSSKY